MRLGLRLLLLGLASLALWAGPGQAAPKIASLNLCADQYLVALADPDQITSLSPDAHDPVLSYAADQARAYPTTKGSAEAIAALGPDLVFVNRYGRDGTKSLLRELGIEVIELETAQDFNAIKKQTRLIARAIGHPERGEMLIAAMEAELAALAPPADRTRLVAVNLQRRGFVAGKGTLIDEVMARAGLDNLARQLSGDAVRQVPLESIIVHQPDILILNDPDFAEEDWGTILLRHPALERLFPPERRIVLESRYTVCGSPAYPAAVGVIRNRLNAP